MAALPYNSTPVVRIHYTFAGGNRSFIVRPRGEVSLADSAQMFNDLLVAHANCFNNTVSFVSADGQTANANYSVPLDWSVIQGNGGVAGDAATHAFFAGFSARGATGHQVAWRFYGAVSLDHAPDKYRMSMPFEGVWGDFWDDWDSLCQEGVVGDITGAPVILKGYINLGFNAYYQRRARRS